MRSAKSPTIWKRTYSVAATRPKSAEVIYQALSGEDVAIVRRRERVAIVGASRLPLVSATPKDFLRFKRLSLLNWASS